MRRLLLSVSAILVLGLVAAGCVNADASQKPASPAQLAATGHTFTRWASTPP